ncbi:MAG: IS4 family transposase, partial [Planctomycetaceae bacterium]|nr:IS4 family transposase [Planctomycetaceae bacterium]
STIARLVGRQLDNQVQESWLWKGRRVYLFDGTTVSMPDTPKNQAAYPQVYNQKPGLGFPLARVCSLMSLSCGAVLDLGFARYAGKGQGELSLLRKLWDTLSPSDILLTDALLSTWYEMLTLKQGGVDLVSRLNKATRSADFRRGKRLGKGDHIVRWTKPSVVRAVDWKTYKTLPGSVEVRETHVRVEQPGFRTKELVVVTTLLDPEVTTKEDLASLYRSRWSQELDIGELKVTLQMDVLRCKTPELVRKEVWTHILAYNLIRTIMAQSANRRGIQPREISFKGTIQILKAFQPLISLPEQLTLFSERPLFPGNSTQRLICPNTTFLFRANLRVCLG